jgi:hypothetical protein
MQLVLKLYHRYGRLSVAGTVLSKHKIQKLVEEKHVESWVILDGTYLLHFAVVASRQERYFRSSMN